MIFSPPLWQAVLAGTKTITSRAIKPTTKCVCGEIYSRHKLSCQRPEAFTIDLAHYPAKCDSFFPAPYAIGKELCVQTKRGKGAICRYCSAPKSWHTKSTNEIFEELSAEYKNCFETITEWGTASYLGGKQVPMKMKFPTRNFFVEETQQGKHVRICESHHPSTGANKTPWMLDFYVCHCFVPTKIKIVGGMWRDDFLKQPLVIMHDEADREGFPTFSALETRLKELNPKGLPLWRVEFELVK